MHLFKSLHFKAACMGEVEMKLSACYSCGSCMQGAIQVLIITEVDLLICLNNWEAGLDWDQELEFEM
jgi:hypothetical protein